MNNSFRRLGDVCQLVGGGTPRKFVKEYYGGNIPWATVRDLKGEVLEKTEFSITNLGLNNSSANLIPKDSVIIATRVGLGKMSYTEKEVAINQDLRGIIPKSRDLLDSRYLFWWLKSKANDIENKGLGATVKGVKLNYIKNLQIPLPSLQEQKQIVSLLDQAFQAIDQAKANVEQNIQNAEELFQSKLKNLFFNNNENWSYYQLGNVTKIVNGGTPKSENESFWNGNNLWITPKDMGELKSRYVDSTPRTITDLGLKKSSAKLLPSKSVILSTRAPIGYLAINQEPMATNQGCRGIIPKGDIISDFVYYFLKLNVNTLNRLGGGSTFKELTSKNLASLETPLPSLNEQEQIVKELDEILINKTKLLKTYQRKSSNLTELKNALLQKAFQGELTQENVKATADAYE